MAYKKKAKKTRQRIEAAVVHVSSSFNNTLVAVTTPEGDVLMRGSCGKMQFKGARKGTPFAASQVGATLAKDMLALGIKTVEMNFKGPGSGRDSVARAMQAAGIAISVLRDVTELPHNGARLPKRRRV